MQVQFYFRPIKWTELDLGPVDDLIGHTSWSKMVFKTF